MTKYKLSLFRRVEHHNALTTCTDKDVVPTFTKTVIALCERCNLNFPDYFKDLDMSSVLAFSWIDQVSNKHILAYHSNGDVILCILRKADSLKKDTIFLQDISEQISEFNYCSYEQYVDLLDAVDYASLKSKK